MAYASLERLKEYLGISVTADDALLETCIARAQVAIESKLDRVFEASADSTRTFDAIADVDGPTLYLDRDLCAITSITNGDSTAVATSSYVTEPRRDTPYYAIRLRESATISWTYDDSPEGAISVVGRWAYSLTAPEDIVQATLRWAALMYRQKDSGFETVAIPDAGIVTTPAGIPKDVGLLLAPYRRYP